MPIAPVADQKSTYSLVLIGNLSPNVDLKIISRRRDLHSSIITTVYVPGFHISPLISHADLFVFPFLYEGFGLPALEAQQAGVAVACSTAGSLPEVAADGALYFNPLSVDEMAKTMERILSDQEYRAVLQERWMLNRQRFSWEHTAASTRSVYRRILSSPPVFDRE